MWHPQKQLFNVWLIASGAAGADLEETLRMNSLGHFLHRLETQEDFFETLSDLDRESVTFPNLLMYLMPPERQKVDDFFRDLKASPGCGPVPVIVFYEQNISPDVKHLYVQGASSVVRVPMHFDGLVEVMRTIEAYWSRVVSPPVPTL